MVVLVIILIAFIINTLVLLCYCVTKNRADNRARAAKTSSVHDGDTISHTSGGGLKRSGIKRKIKFLCQYIDNHYMYGLMRYEIILTGRIPSYRIRRLIYKHIFRMKITRESVIWGGCEFRSPWNIHMGNCVVGANCILDGRNGIFIDDNVVFGSGVHIWTEEHSVDDKLFRVLPENAKPVYIHQRAWVCSDSTILPGVTIGKGAVVASRACVTVDCSDYGIYGGVPARRIKERNHELEYTLSGKPHWHFY